MPLGEGERELLEKLLQDARILSEETVVRDDAPLTEELDKAVIERLQAYLTRTKRSAESAARSMGISGSTLSQIVTGTYAADREPHVRAIDKWLSNQLLREAAPKPPGYVKTGVALEMQAAIQWGIKTESMVVIVGPSGIGKTMVLQAIRSEVPGSVYFSVDSASRRPHGVLMGLAMAMRMTAIKLGTMDLFNHLVRELKDSHRSLFIDEAHLLTGRAHDDSLQILRHLHDKTGCPLILVGNGRLASYLKDGHSDGFDPIDQIYGRIAFWLDLTERARGESDDGKPLATVEDIRRMFAASKVRLTADGERFLAMLASQADQGCYRAVKRLVQMAELVSQGKPIDAAMLRAIQRQRLGRRAAEAVELRIEETARAASA